MSRVVMAIDPGASGAISWSSEDRLDVVKMPDTPLGILSQIREICDGHERGDVVCWLEDVGHGLPGQSSSATAKFARHNGHLEMALLSVGAKIVKVTPSKWEKQLGIGKSTECGKPEWKRRLKQKAQELYPQFKVTLVNCDALLLLDVALKNEG